MQARGQKSMTDLCIFFQIVIPLLHKVFRVNLGMLKGIYVVRLLSKMNSLFLSKIVIILQHFLRTLNKRSIYKQLISLHM